MKLVREYIEFERTGDPFKDLDLGIEGKIDMWMTEMGFHPDKYEINDDLTIDVFGDAKLTNANLERLPKYIKFGRIGGGFYAGGNPWQSLEGFPNEVLGDLQLKSPATPAHYNENIFAIDEIEKLIKVHGTIYN